MLVRVRRLPAEVLLLGTVLLWSFNFTAVRYGVTHGVQPHDHQSTTPAVSQRSDTYTSGCGAGRCGSVAATSR